MTHPGDDDSEDEAERPSARCSFSLKILAPENEADESPANAATQGLLTEKIDQVLKILTYPEREIIKLRYGLRDGYTYTIEQVARLFKLTRKRVREIETRAVNKLRAQNQPPLGA
jgi:RNA polymerase sigma factor (sigma-70 family)